MISRKRTTRTKATRTASARRRTGDGRQEAAEAGVEDIAGEARVAGSHRPPPQLVADSLREPLIRIARTRPPSTLPRPRPDRLGRHVGKRATNEDRAPESNKAERHGHGHDVPGDRGQQLSDPASILVVPQQKAVCPSTGTRSNVGRRTPIATSAYLSDPSGRDAERGSGRAGAARGADSQSTAPELKLHCLNADKPLMELVVEALQERLD